MPCDSSHSIHDSNASTICRFLYVCPSHPTPYRIVFCAIARATSQA